MNRGPWTVNDLFSAICRYFRRSWSLAILAAILIPITIFHPYANWPPIRADGVGYHLWTYAILDGDLNFATYRDTHPWSGVNPADPTRDFYHNKYGPGVAVIRLPIMMWLVDRPPHTLRISVAEHWASLILSALALWLTAWLALRVCRLTKIPDWAANTAILAMIFGTGLFHYSTYDGYHATIWSALGLSWLMYFGCKSPNESPTYYGWRRVITTGLLCFLLVLIRNTNVIAIGFITARFWFKRDVRGLLAQRVAIGLGSVVGLVLQVGLNSHAYGRLTWSAYTTESFHWENPHHLSVVISLNQGLVVFYPIVAIVILGGLGFSATRRAGIWLTMLLGSYVALYGYWWCWWFGAGFGHRGFVEFMPLAIPLLAAILAQSKGVVRVALLTAVALSVFATMQLMVGIWRGSMPWEKIERVDYFDHLIGRRSMFGGFESRS